MAKRLTIFLLIILISYIVYYDISYGTFHTTEIQQVSNVPSELYFQEIEITSGDTLLTLVELNSDSIHIPPSKVIIDDFQSLNPFVEPNKLQIGKVYKIPVYK